jgi:hypothetical protein
MPRQRTKGESLAFRLPVHLDDVFTAIAAKRKMQPRDLAAEIVAAWVLDQARHPTRDKPVEKSERNPIVAEFFE